MKINRINAVLNNMKTRGIAQLLISDILSIYYLTGIYLDPGERFYALYLNENGDQKIFLNEMFSVPKEMEIQSVWYNDTQSVTEVVAGHMDVSTVLGIDKSFPARFLIPLQEEKAAAGFVLGSLCVDEARGCKDTEEQALMKEVSHVNDLAMAEFKKLIVPGITEKEFADQMLPIYQRLGAEDYSFEPIVSFGANTADTHHHPEGRVLKEGDCVLIDTGCKKDMYCADMTRTFFYKSVSEKHRAVYETVRKANEAAIAMIKPGIPLKEIDRTARSIIEQAGYGKYFLHRLGHFIGLDVHEYGDVSSSNEMIAKPGMIFSVEPGIYLEGDMGVRIEDLVLVTEDGCIRLNQCSKELEIIARSDMKKPNT